MTDEALAAVNEDDSNPELDAAKAKAAAINATRSGKGTRVKAGQTRGRSSLVISYEFFDEKQPDTLPKTLSEFMELYKAVTGKEVSESEICSYLIDGFNIASYAAASDPIVAYVEAYWDDDVKTRFKATIRNYSRDAGVSIEDAVALIKPAYLKGNPAK